MKRFGRAILPLGITALLAMGCQQAGEPTAPFAARTIDVPDSPLRSSGSGKEDTLRLLKRTISIKSKLSISKVIGPEGGEIILSGTGAKVIFPAGAVQKAKKITMTARAGNEIVYDFEPHMVFPVPVTIVQELEATNALGNNKILGSLQGGYFDGEFERNLVDDVRRLVKCKEVLPGLLAPDGRKFSFKVTHFSGYLASSGRSSDE